MPPTSREPVRRSTPSAGGGGGGWLFLVIVVGAVAAIYVFAPELPRRIFGRADRPADGPEPTATQDSSGALGKREVTATNPLQEPSQFNRGPDSLVPKNSGKAADPVAKPAAPVANKDEAEAQKILAAAEKAYQAFQWDQAGSTANKITSMSVKPATKVRAKDIVRGAQALAKIFKELDDRDELSRNYDTHPSLVQINTSGTLSYGVPIVSIEDPTVVEKDPLGWISNQRKTGKITMLVRGKKDFITTALPADKVGEVAPVDMEAVKQEKAEEFRSRLDRLQNGDMARDALAWYEAAKFAYRNRLDEHVTEMMDQALLLDPMLVASVREDKAATLFANVVLHMKNGNQKQAAAFIAVVNKRFADTPSGQQAKLFYDGNTAALLAASREAEAKAAEAEKQRREARIERAKELGDEQAAAKIAKEPDRAAPDPDVQASAATGDEGKADEYFAHGKDFYSQAIDAGNSDARDGLYTKALGEFTKAMAIYNKLLEKAGDDSPIAMKALECNKLRFGSLKQRRFH